MRWSGSWGQKSGTTTASSQPFPRCARVRSAEKGSRAEGRSPGPSVSARRWCLPSPVVVHLGARVDWSPDVDDDVRVRNSSAAIWFISWPAYAITHGLNPLYSTAVGYPTGINLIFAAYGIVLAPVTWLFGPVAALNVGLTVGPVLSALGMFALMKRWVSWMPAAVVSGLFYGFSPFVLANLSVAHADFGLVALPPLIIICLDELLICQRRRPVLTGIVLGLLVSAQFLIGLEVLLLMLIEVVIGVVMLVVYEARRSPLTLRQHARRAAIGFLAGAITVLVLLAYPAWLGFAGPAHFSKMVHPGLPLTSFRLHATSLVFPALTSDLWQTIVGGYQGPVLNSLYFSQYFGIGAVVVVLAGIIIWRRDRLLWFFGILTLVTLFLATASGPGLAMFPFLSNIEPLHFVLFAYLTAGVLLGVIVDASRAAVDRRSGARRNAGNGGEYVKTAESASPLVRNRHRTDSGCGGDHLPRLHIWLRAPQ